MHLKGEKIENYTDINLHYFFNCGNGTCGDRNCSGKSIYSDNANASVMVKLKSIFKSTQSLISLMKMMMKNDLKWFRTLP